MYHRTTPQFKIYETKEQFIVHKSAITSDAESRSSKGSVAESAGEKQARDVWDLNTIAVILIRKSHCVKEYKRSLKRHASQSYNRHGRICKKIHAVCTCKPCSLASLKQRLSIESRPQTADSIPRTPTCMHDGHVDFARSCIYIMDIQRLEVEPPSR